MNINQCQLTNLHLPLIYINQQDINNFLAKLLPIPNTQEQYQNLLKLWNEFDKQRNEKMIKSREILEVKAKQIKNYKKKNVCLVCYEELGNIRNQCRICGVECCEKCIARYRVINKPNNERKSQQKNQDEPVPCCQICDKKFLNALLELQYQKQLQLRRKVLEAIKKIDDSDRSQTNPKNQVDSDSPQNSKCFRMKRYYSQLIQTATELSSQNESIKCQSIISWSQNLKNKLKLTLKYNTIKNNHLNRSSNSSINQYETQLGFQPPRVHQFDTNKSQNNKLNQSSEFSSIIQDDTQLIHKEKCCTCTIM